MMIAAAAATLAVPAAASANQIGPESFKDFTVGAGVGGQFGWSADDKLDQRVIDVDGHHKLRMSNAVTTQSFDDLPFSAPVDPAGEKEPDNNVLTNQFTIKSETGERQPGLKMSVSPTNRQGDRMSYLRFEDSYDGIRVFFDDTPNKTTASDFTDRWIATLDREDEHTVRFDTTFIPGSDNDVVRVKIDGNEKICGTSWENYYRFGDEQAQRDPASSDRLVWRISSTPTAEQAAKLAGHGFLFDDVMSKSEHKSVEGAGCELPVGPQGMPGQPGQPGAPGTKGDTGAGGHDGTNGSNGSNGSNGVDGSNGGNGVNGKDGATMVIHQSLVGPKLIGNTIRTLHAPARKGMKLVSVSAKMRNKALSLHSKAVTVDLRGKVVGNYNVFVTAKYHTKSGKVKTFRTMRSLSVTRA